MDDVVADQDKLHLLKAFHDSFGKNPRTETITPHSQRKVRCYSTNKRLSMRKSSTIASNCTTIALIPDGEAEKVRDNQWIQTRK